MRGERRRAWRGSATRPASARRGRARRWARSRTSRSCVDPFGERLYLTEDKPDGCFYRFTPDRYPDLDAGPARGREGRRRRPVTWARGARARTRSTPTPTRKQVAGRRRVQRRRGHVVRQRRRVLHDQGRQAGLGLRHRRRDARDDLRQRHAPATARRCRRSTTSASRRSGDIFICEDGDNLEICLITPDRQVAALPAAGPRASHAGDPGPRQRDRRRDVRPVGHAHVLRRAAHERRAACCSRSPGRSAASPARRRALVAGLVAVADRRGPADERRPRSRRASRLRHARSISARNLAGRGLAVTFELDEPAGARRPRCAARAGRSRGGRRRSRCAGACACASSRARASAARSAAARRAAARAAASSPSRTGRATRGRSRRRVTVRASRRRRRVGRR